MSLAPPLAPEAREPSQPKENAETSSLATVFRSKPVLSVGLAALFCFGLEFVPALEKYRVFSKAPKSEEPERPATNGDALPDARVGEAELAADTTTGLAPGQNNVKTEKAGLFGGRKEAELAPIATEDPPIPLIDPSGHALDGFFAALTKTQAKEPHALTRIAHFGDSVVVSDYVTGTLRRLFHRDFGDGGHGYVLIANAWPAYFHNDVFRFATSGFKVSRIVGPYADDGFYGLGGVSFRATRGAIAQFGTAESGDEGRRVSRFIVDYLAHPAGGRLTFKIDGKPAGELDARATPPAAHHHELSVPDGEHRLEIGIQSGEARLFGVALEREGPGVVLDALGIQGARIRFLDKQDDAHYRDELQLRGPNLIVYQFGANESGDGYAYPMDEYLSTMKEVIVQGQKALPKSSCLVVGAMDRARVEHGETTSMKIIGLIVTEQRRAAEELGCAYFDTYNSMGGFGSMPKWVKRSLGQADMTHPTAVGAERIATWLHRALLRRYAEFLGRPN